VDEDYRGFVQARYGPLVRTAMLMGCSRQDAEDAAQDALARCYGSWARVRAADDPEAYAYRVLVNGLARARRRRWRGEVPHADPPEPAAGAGLETAVLQRATVRAALARLSREHREVLVLRFFADLTESRTAAVLGIPAGTVKSRTARALAQLATDPTLELEMP
jgi:RNA polymerase sigma-70 factor (sigma-E family)